MPEDVHDRTASLKVLGGVGEKMSGGSAGYLSVRRIVLIIIMVLMKRGPSFRWMAR